MLAGKLELAQRVNACALNLIESHGRRGWEPEIWRVRAELLLAQDPGNMQEAEACLQRSLGISRERQGLSLELRSAIRLARLWVSQNRARDALSLLQPLYQRFNEGFETLDVVGARTLIDDIASGRSIEPGI